MSVIRMSIKEFNLPLFIEFIEKVKNCGNDGLCDIHRILTDIHIGSDANKTITIKGKNKTLFFHT